MVSGAVLMEYEHSPFNARCVFVTKAPWNPRKPLRYKGICTTANAAPLLPYPRPNCERMVKMG
ncbi:hypothetical protein BQ8482_190024 [Mesorhizobium delmotii]|uniref:Uncharacterized protein n=1 Tax=Mesorhizobium delmotii TaxID=1631247 RepID=A0A2P9AJJ1_9HYPH|nr:hypothetical protein BQ8482_190024 [Mesorhizobium delmotii]